MKNIDLLIKKFKEFREELNKNVVAPMTMQMSEAEKAEAGPNPKVMSVKKPISPKDVSDAGPASFKVDVPKPNKGATSSRHPMSKDEIGQDMMAMSEALKFDNNKQWKLDKGEGTNREADPQRDDDPRGTIRMVKDEHPTAHNTEKFSVMSPAPQKTLKIGKADECAECNSAPCKCGNDENKAPGKHSGYGF